MMFSTKYAVQCFKPNPSLAVRVTCGTCCWRLLELFVKPRSDSCFYSASLFQINRTRTKDYYTNEMGILLFAGDVIRTS
jgi:hypothetical protein